MTPRTRRLTAPRQGGKKGNLVAIDSNALTGYRDEYLDCRGMQHSWVRVGYFADGTFVSRLSHCTRCGTQKIMTMTRAGTLIRSRYDHPDDYLFSGQGIDRTDIRREELRRASGQVFSSKESLFASTQPKPTTIAEKRRLRKGA